MVNTPEIRVECSDREKFHVVARVTERLRADPAVLDVITIDGVRARFEAGWGLVRASNTQPVLVSRYEARDQRALDQIRKTVEQHVATARSSG